MIRLSSCSVMKRLYCSARISSICFASNPSQSISLCSAILVNNRVQQLDWISRSFWCGSRGNTVPEILRPRVAHIFRRKLSAEEDDAPLLTSGLHLENSLIWSGVKGETEPSARLTRSGSRFLGFEGVFRCLPGCHSSIRWQCSRAASALRPMISRCLRHRFTPLSTSGSGCLSCRAPSLKRRNGEGEPVDFIMFFPLLLLLFSIGVQYGGGWRCTRSTKAARR